MGRVTRHLIVLTVVLLLFGVGCSSDSTTTDAQGPVTTTVGDPTATTAAAGSEAPPDTTSDTQVDGSEAPPEDVTDPEPNSGPATTVAAPTVAEGGGWRLAVSHPTAGDTMGRMAVVCYEVSGPSREADIALEVTVEGRAPVRVAASVGRGRPLSTWAPPIPTPTTCASN